MLGCVYLFVRVCLLWLLNFGVYFGLGLPLGLSSDLLFDVYSGLFGSAT